MEIINTTITRTAEEITSNGTYTLDYTVLNGKLERIQASIRSNKSEDNGNRYLGSIVYENGSINSNLLYYAGAAISPLFVDFEKFMNVILKSAQEEIESAK